MYSADPDPSAGQHCAVRNAIVNPTKADFSPGGSTDAAIHGASGTVRNYEVLSDTIVSVRCGGGLQKAWKAKIDADYKKSGCWK